MATAGYSKRSISEKLGLKLSTEGFVVDPPPEYTSLLDELPAGLTLGSSRMNDAGFIHLFVKQKAKLRSQLPKLRRQLKPDGMLWISWPKATSGVETDVSERTVRELGLENGLVDVKVCAIDDTWSGLKFVIPVKDRKK